MINIFETSISDNSTDFLHSVGDFTSILSLVPLVIFVWLAIRSKNIKSFQLQISVFIAVYIIGGIIENNNGRIAMFSVLPPEIGSQIHVIAAIFFTIMIWFRFYYADLTGKRMIEKPDNSHNNADKI
jgi:predicted permease